MPLIPLIVLIIIFILIKIKGKLSWPVLGKITSPFGDRIHPVTGVASFHNGIDIAAPIGTDIKAPASGIVHSTYFTNEGGNQVIIEHAAFRTGYAHMQRADVQAGQKVSKGEVIGTVGNTGATTGPHLHFTVRNRFLKLVDPIYYLPKKTN